MKIIWTNLAIERLEEIVDYIKKDNVEAAENLVINIFDKVEKLKAQPFSGRYLDEVKQNNIREIFEGNYRIIYKIEEKRLIVLTVRHLKRLLNRDEIK